MVLCNSTKSDSVVGHSKPTLCTRNLFEFFAFTGCRDAKNMGSSTCAPVRVLMPSLGPGWNSHYLILNSNFNHGKEQFQFLWLTWLIIKIFGIFLLNFLWFRNTTMTVKFATIPTEAVVLWIIRIVSALEFSLLEFLDVEFKLILQWQLFYFLIF